MKHFFTYFIRSPTYVMTITESTDVNNKIRERQYPTKYYNEKEF